MMGDLQGSEWLGWHAHTRTPQPLLVCGQPETSPLLYPHNSDADTWETPRGATHCTQDKLAQDLVPNNRKRHQYFNACHSG